MLLSLLAAPLLFPAQSPYDPDPEQLADRWIVVYNTNWPDADGNGINDSEEVAAHWAKRRGAPVENILGIDFSHGTLDYYAGQSGWEDFWDEMILPLRAKVVDDVNTHVLGFLFVYGVPMRVIPPGFSTRGLDTTLIHLWDLGTRSTPLYATYGHADFYFDSSPTIGVEPGRFDPDTDRYGLHRTYLVSRIDGLTKEHAMEMVDSALYGDVYLSNQPGHYTGTAYCDTRYGAYTANDLANYPFNHFTYANADKDMAYGRDWMQQAGFDLRWEPYATEIGEPNAKWEDGTSALTAPSAMLYEGWYNFNIYHDVFTWMVGSMACDLNSNSVSRLRQENPGTFLSESLHQGLTCGTGVIAEPYLNGHPYPEVFAYYMANGYPFAEAARISDSKVRWTNLYLGDPLYQPFRAGKLAQLDIDAPPPSKMLNANATLAAGEWELSTYLDTLGNMPDLGTLTVEYGEDLSFGHQAVGDDNRARLFHHTTLTGLGADRIIYYRADYTDPVGNIGAGDIYVLHTGLETADVIATLSSDSLNVAVGVPFTLELAIGASDGLAALSSYSVNLTAAHLGLTNADILPRFSGPHASVFRSADETVRVVQLLVPGTLSAGTYTFDVQANSSLGSAADSVTVVIS
ncbi:MAG: TIGR03790 family protein [Planctomycetota bacterium]